ncbi:MAG: hypothetical protein KatS3mg111_4129 [Pirellulaceae bacterium]|nr:MAG: hypothetical protein KatS3mg111_4129 [Pirellulaceae bacterium]
MAGHEINGLLGAFSVKVHGIHRRPTRVDTHVPFSAGDGNFFDRQIVQRKSLGQVIQFLLALLVQFQQFRLQLFQRFRSMANIDFLLRCSAQPTSGRGRPRADLVAPTRWDAPMFCAMSYESIG